MLLSDDEPSRKKAKATVTSLQGALRRLRHGLEDLLVAKARDEYFPEADRLRGRGEPTDHLRSPDQRRRGPHSEMDLEGLVRLLTCADDPSALSCDRRLEFDGEAEKRSQRVMEWLLDYAAGRGRKASPQKHQTQNPPAPPVSSVSTCLLCSTDSHPVTFTRRPELTRHCKDQHVGKGTFKLPFPCPECIRLGNAQYIVSSALNWSYHTERVHGKLHAPRLLASQSTEKLSARPATKRKRATKAKMEEPLPGMSVFVSLEEPEPQPKKICSSRRNTGSSVCQPLLADMDVPAPVLPGIPPCKPEGSACIPADKREDEYSDASMALAASSMDGEDIAQDRPAEPLLSLYVDLSLANPVCTLYGDTDQDQCSSCPDLTDCSSDMSDDTTSHCSLDYPHQLADEQALTVSPLSTWLVKPALESQAIDSEVTWGHNHDKWAHEDWQLDFGDEGELFSWGERDALCTY